MEQSYKPISILMKRVDRVMPSLPVLLKDVRNCTICSDYLPHGVRPIVQAHAKSRILIAGQAPGRKVHESDDGLPFHDASGDRLREWMGITRDQFYDPMLVAILPMGFCYPGTGTSGDLPPRPECAPAWRKQLLASMKHVQLTLVIGAYAHKYHLPDAKGSLTETVHAWKTYWPDVVPMPHPSPRNNIWLKKNPWFAKELVPTLQMHIDKLLSN